MKLAIPILFILSFFVADELFAQKTESTIPDTLEIDSIKVHSPTKATLFSVAIPGLGQVYNKK